MVEPLDPRALATGLTWDSRDAKPGDVYVALPGERVDGHDFIGAREVIDHRHQLINRAFVQCIDRRVGDRNSRHLLAGGNIIILHEEIAVAVEQRLLIAHALRATAQ